MIADNVAHLIGLLTSLTEFENSAGLALGGKGSDPGLLKVPLPAAWVMYAKDDVDEAPFGHGGVQPGLISSTQVMLLQVNVLIYLPYTSQDDLLTIQLPLIEKVAATIHGTDAPSGYRWRYMGQKLALVYPDRIAYEQHYTLTTALSTIS